MRNAFFTCTLIAAAALWCAPGWPCRNAAADEPAPLVREIFVPYKDLDALLESQPRRVLLPREQYEDLLKKAKKAPDTHAPQAAAILGAEYVCTIEEERARWTGKLAVEVLEEGLQALPLEVAGVSLRSAAMDGKAAAIGRADDGRLMLLVEGKGRHELVLEMVSPLETTAARQTLNFRLPYPAAAKFLLTVPGDVEVQSGATVVGRVVDEAARVTRFELLPPRGDVSLQMTLNSRLLRRQRAVVARSVLVDEITQAYERLHATVSLAVLHQPVDRFRFVVPEGFEITEVGSPLLARWAVEKEAQRQVLDVRLREATVQTVVLNLSAVRTPPPLDKWTMPRLEPLEVVGQMAVVGLVVEDRLNTESVASKGLIGIDTPILARAIPPSMLRGEPGAPTIRPVVAFYAPQGDFSLSARFTKPPAETEVVTNVLLILEDRGLTARGLFVLTPKVEKLFGPDFSVPAGWHVLSVTGADGKPLGFERFGPADQAGRVRVRLAQGVAPGQSFGVRFEATCTPAGWLAEAKAESGEPKAESGKRKAERGKGTPPASGLQPPASSLPSPATHLPFPVFAVAGATRDVGAVAVEARSDLVVRPEALKQLTPLDEKEKKSYGLAEVATSLAYRYESQPYQAAFSVERTQPRLTARTFSFLRVEPDALIAHYEVLFRVDEARTRTLSLLLPKSTPTALRIVGMDGVRVKEFSSEERGELRRWNVLLAEPRRGAVRLAVDFQQPLSAAKGQSQQVLKGQTLPVVQADRVAHQSGLVAVEGSAELDVQVQTDVRKVHVGELVDAAYQPGKRLLGAFGFVGEPAVLKVDISRHPGYGLQPAIVQKATLNTDLSAGGEAVTEAVFRLHNKDLYLEIELPAGSEPWAVLIDESPVKPQRQDDRLLVDLPAAKAGATRTLKLTYRTTVHAVAMLGEVDLPAPKLRLHAERGAAGIEVPLVDLEWRVTVPTGYKVVRSRGTVVGEAEPPERPAIVNVALATCGLALYRPEWELPSLRKSETGYSKAKSAAPAASYYKAAAGERGYAAADEQMPAADKTPAARESFETDRLADVERSHIPQPQAKSEAAPSGRPSAMRPGSKSPTETRWREAKPEPKSDLLIRGLRTDEETPPPTVAPPREPAKTAEPAPKPAPPPEFYTRGWKGRRSLQIELTKTPDAPKRTLTFRSLGVEPRLVITLANGPRFRMLGWALAAAVALIGLRMTNRPARAKVRFLVAVAALATLVPMVPGWGELVVAGNLAVYAAAALVVYYVLASLVRWLAGRVCRSRSARQEGRHSCLPGVTTTLVLAALALCQSGLAQPPPPEAKTAPYVIQVVEPAEPVKVPDDALILPYDPESKTGIQEANQVLVPYDKYVELWNRAYPDKKLEVKAPPLPYGLAGAAYKATLQGEEFLRIEGQMEIEVFGDQPVTIPLGLTGGVLARADLDGRPARLSIVRTAPSPVGPNPPPQQQPAAQQPAQPGPAQGGAALARPMPPADGSLVALLVSGKGRHRLVLEVRMRLERTGGWRVMDGALPAAPATSLAIVVPQAQTEVRLGELTDRRSYDLDKPDQRIETALGLSGRIHLQWRPKVGEGEVDRSLTAQSSAVLDVQEDGLRVVWQTTLAFRRGQRESFTFYVPPDYLVEKVEGGNVRGWEVRKEEKRQVVEVTLLKPAKESERLVLRLWRAGRMGEDLAGASPLVEFDAPAVSVADAAMDTGVLTIRRSPLLDVRTIASPRLSRTEVSTRGPEAGTFAGSEDSPLGARPYEAYEYSAAPFSLRLAAAPIAGRATADVQTVLKIAQYDGDLESRIKLEVRDRPIHRVEVVLPEGLNLDRVSAPGEFQWTTTPQQKRTLLTIYLAAGLVGDVPIVLHGTMRRPEAAGQVALPGLEVRGVDRQQGDVAVQADPGVEVKAEGLENCESVLLERVRTWLKPDQLQATALALHYERPDYRGTLRLTPRRPIVSCQTATNVRVTDRAVEETILLDYTIQQAGIRRLAFLLPASMSDSRFQVPMLRQKTISEPKDGLVQVRLELQDPLMNRLQVLVQNDRLLTADVYTAPIPIVETADAAKVETTRQFVALQSAGRDEVVVRSAAGLEPLSEAQEAFRALRDLLGGGAITKAYLVQGGTGPGPLAPKLQFATQVRKAVETAGARIWLAETDLVCDANGAYRARQVYRLDNTINQFLEVELSEGATLWTAQVAGEPVKPIRGTDESSLRRVRIPLVKTAPGDRDFEVVLKYGGHLGPLRAIDKLTFPLIRTINIGVEQSQVRLHLPETHRYFRFGGTMSPIAEDDLVAGLLTYERKQAQRLLDTLRQGDPFARALASNNLKALVDSSSPMTAGRYGANARQEFERNQGVMRQAEGELEKLQRAPVRAESLEDNRMRMNERVQEQRTTRAHNVVQDLGGNFGLVAEQPVLTGPDNAGQLNAQWLNKSRLENAEVAANAPMLGQSRFRAGGKEPQGVEKKAGEGQVQTDLRSSGFAQLQAKDMGVAESYDAAKPGQGPGKDVSPAQKKDFKEDLAGTEVERYQKRLREQQAAQQGPMSGRGGRVGEERAGIAAEGGDRRGAVYFDDSTVPPPLTPADAEGREEARAKRPETIEGLQAAGIPAGLQSLDFEIPTRGTVFVFTLPGGDVSVSARAVSRELTDVLARVAAVIAAAAVVLWIASIASLAWLRGLDSRTGAVLLLCVGVLLTVLGFVVIGLVLLAAGIAIGVRRFRRRRPAAAVPATP